MSKVTVIIPVYNSEKYISKCLDSILNQSYDDYEILIVNDGSKDNSKRIVDEYKGKYPEKIIFYNQENKGVSITRNESIKKANGKYVMFVDNDDYLDSDYIEKYVNAIEEADYDIAIGGYRRITEKNKILQQVKLKDEEWSKLIVMAPWAKIYNKQFLIDNNITFLKNNLGEDVYFNLKAMFLCKNIKIIDYIGYNWFFNTASVSNTIQKNITELQVYELLNNCYEELKESKLMEKNYEILKTYFTRYIIWLLYFSTKGLDKKTIYNEYDKLFKWLEQKFPDYKKNKMISFTKPKGERFNIRVFTKVFLIAHKLHIAKMFIYIYSKI